MRVHTPKKRDGTPGGATATKSAPLFVGRTPARRYRGQLTGWGWHRKTAARRQFMNLHTPHPLPPHKGEGSAPGTASSFIAPSPWWGGPGWGAATTVRRIRPISEARP